MIFHEATLIDLKMLKTILILLMQIFGTLKKSLIFLNGVGFLIAVNIGTVNFSAAAASAFLNRPLSLISQSDEMQTLMV